ncbi:MAG: GtrA family protein [Oscillospiraceae bacterium]|nr:GtrA family protein [Oscillospiraceae bacterium]
MSEKKKELIRAVKFTLFSISAGIIQTVVFTLMTELTQLNYWVCYLTSLVLSVLWNFTLNRKITFHSANNVPIAMLKVAAYYLVFTPLSTWGGDKLIAIGWNEYVVFVISMLTNFVTEFLYQRFFVFGSSIDTAKKKETV